jgi:hypothetical protein
MEYLVKTTKKRTAAQAGIETFFSSSKKIMKPNIDVKKPDSE